jgi:zinc transporter
VVDDPDRPASSSPPSPSSPSARERQLLSEQPDDGLVCGYRFDVEGRGRLLASTAEAARWLAERRQQGEAGPGRGFTWVHLNLSHAATLPWLRQHSGLGDDFFEALEGGSRSARIERAGSTLFAVLNDVAFDFHFDSQDVETLWVSVGEDLVVSARRRPLRSVDRLRTAVRGGESMASSVELLDHLLRDQADELQRILRRTGGHLDAIEDDVLAGRHRRHRQELARQRRLMVRLQRLLTPEPTALGRAISRPPAWLRPADVQQLAQANEEFSLVLRDIAALQDRIRLMQDESATRLAEETNRSLFLLTMVTVLALPINLVSGLFGMNVGGVPLGDDASGFWVMVTLIATLTGLIGWLLVRRLGPGDD